MEFEGEFTVPQPGEKVYAFFANAQELIDCLDDPHTLETMDDRHFRGTLTTGVAFIRGTFRFEGEYTELSPPGGLAASLNGTGMGSGLTAVVRVALSESAGSTTSRWKAEMNVTGSVAAVGERIIRGTVDKKVQGLFANAEKKLGGRA